MKISKCHKHDKWILKSQEYNIYLYRRKLQSNKLLTVVNYGLYRIKSGVTYFAS